VAGLTSAYVGFQTVQKTASTMYESSTALESYRGTLNVVLKDQEKAAKMMKWATEFANSTPFETESIVEATVKLESYGLKAMDVLPRVGDMAGVMGKDLIQAVEAIADAQNGELERLKEFGITKKKIIEHGNKALGMADLVNKKGQITNQENFNKALFSLMETNFKGGMAQQASMQKGLMSTVTGVWKSGLATISGVKATGEIMDGSLFHMLKVNTESLVKILNQANSNGTFEMIGQKSAAFFRFIGSGINFATAGMKKVFPYIKKGGKILVSLIKETGKNIKKLKPVIMAIGDKVKWFKSVFSNGFNKSRLIIEENLPKLNAFKDSLIDIAMKGIGLVGRAFEWAQPPIGWLIENGLPLAIEAFTSITGIASDLYNHFSDKWSLVAPVFETIGTALQNGLLFAFELVKPIIEWLITDGFPIMNEILFEVIDTAAELYTFFAENWTTIEPIIVGITGALLLYKAYMIASSIVTAIQVGLITALTVAMSALSTVIAILTSPITLVVAAIAAVIAIGWLVYKNWDEIMAWFKQKFADFITWISPVTDFISSAFTTAWETVKSVWTGAGEWFSGLWSGIGESFSGFINLFLSGVNWLIDGLNKIQIDIPDWVPNVGGQTFGLQIPNIPYLATGGVTTGPTLAMIGEGREQEAVLPLSKLEGLVRLSILRALKMDKKSKEDSIGSRLNRLSGGSNVFVSNFNITIDYKPKFIIEGNASEEDLVSAAKKGHDDLEKRMESIQIKKKRLKF